MPPRTSTSQDQDHRRLGLIMRRSSGRGATSSGAPQVVRRFDNGDMYQGAWRGGCPDGEGRYSWCDGSMYDGGWTVRARCQS